MRSVTALVTIVTFLVTGCASRTDLKLYKAQERIAELEKHIAGKDEDNAMLQQYALQLQAEIMAWEQGALMQAQHIERLRQHCEL